MVLASRLTRRMQIECPVVVLGVDGAQAAAVAREGGVGLVAQRSEGPAPWAFALANGASATLAEVRTEDEARRMLDIGVDFVQARDEGQAFVCWLADLISRRSYDALLIQASGVADGRGLAAALMLGADGLSIDAGERGDDAAILVRRIADQASLLLHDAA